MTDISSRARRRRARYAWLAVGPVAAAGAIAIFIATQPAGAATTPSSLGSVGNLSDLGSVGNLSGLGAVGNLTGMGGTGAYGPGNGGEHHLRVIVHDEVFPAGLQEDGVGGEGREVGLRSVPQGFRQHVHWPALITASGMSP